MREAIQALAGLAPLNVQPDTLAATALVQVRNQGKDDSATGTDWPRRFLSTCLLTFTLPPSLMDCSVYLCSPSLTGGCMDSCTVAAIHLPLLSDIPRHVCEHVPTFLPSPGTP